MPRSAYPSWQSAPNRPRTRRRAPAQRHSAPRASRSADGRHGPRFRAPRQGPPEAARLWRAPGSCLRGLDEIKEFATQRQEFRILPRPQLIARPWQIDLELDADAAGMRQQADDAVAQINR